MIKVYKIFLMIILIASPGFVSEVPKNVNEFTLYNLADKEFGDRIRPYNSWKYKNDKGYNDFIFIYNQPRPEYENFSGKMVTNEKGTTLKLSNFGGENGYPKYDLKQNEENKANGRNFWI